MATGEWGKAFEKYSSIYPETINLQRKLLTSIVLAEPTWELDAGTTHSLSNIWVFIFKLKNKQHHKSN